MLAKVFFALYQVSSLAIRLLRPQAEGHRTDIENYGFPTTRTSRRGTSAAAMDEFEVISLQSGRTSTTRRSQAPSQASSVVGQDLVT
jgi:hypothetical protein